MAEYIEREMAIAKNHGGVVYIDDIKNIPASDVAPVRYGRWEVEAGMNFFKERNCPVCKKRIESNFWNFCPNCGADMRGINDE